MFAVTSNGFYIEPKGVGDKGVSQIFKTSWDRLRAMSDGSSFTGATAQGLSYGSQPLALSGAPPTGWKPSMTRSAGSPVLRKLPRATA